MELKSNIEVVRTVNHIDLNKFLTKRFKFEKAYEFAAAEEMVKNSVKALNVSSKREFGPWDNEDLEKMISTKRWENYETVLLLCYLCRLGEIPEGKYIIEVCW